MRQPTRPIRTRDELVALAAELGVRPDWHEPDEQEVTARVEGTELDFDNAMGPGDWYGQFWTNEEPRAELHVILCRKEIEHGIARRGPDIATVNLATLFAWATQDDHKARADRLQAELDELRTRLRALGRER